MMMPFIIFEFLSLVLWIVVEVLVVLVMAVYLTTSVDITTTVSVGVIAAIWTVMMFYLWLCVVSHYQILGEVQSMGSDQVKVLQEVRLHVVMWPVLWCVLQQALRTRSCVLWTHKQLVSCLQVVIKQVANR